MKASGTLRKEDLRSTKEARSEERAEAQARDSLAKMDGLLWDDRPGLAAATHSPLGARRHWPLVRDAPTDRELAR